MKIVIIALILIFLFSFVNAELGITYTELGAGILDSEQTDQQIQASQQATLSQMNQKLNIMATQADVDSSFGQLDTAFREYITASQNITLTIFIIIIILNNIAIFSILGLLKAKGYL